MMSSVVAPSSKNNLSIPTSRPRRHGTHIDQPALITHVESILAITKDTAGGGAGAGVFTDDLAIGALHPRRHGTHVDPRGCRGRGADTL